MAYTNGWSEITPAGTDQASTMDDSVRRLRLDMRQRMETLIGVGAWNTDPVGTLAGNVFYIPATHSFLRDNVAWTVNNSSISANAASTTIAVYTPIVLPFNAIITKVRVALQWFTGSTFTGNIYSSTLTAPGEGSAGAGFSVASNTGVWQYVDVGVTGSSLLYTTDITVFTKLILNPITNNLNCRYAGLEVTWTRPTL
jgi:hypothetical protein